MSKMNVKRNKKDEQKKMMVRILCIGLVAVLLLTSGLAMATWIFQDNSNALSNADIQQMINDGVLAYDENGNLVIADPSALTLVPSEESHEGHDHD